VRADRLSMPPRGGGALRRHSPGPARGPRDARRSRADPARTAHLPRSRARLADADRLPPVDRAGIVRQARVHGRPRLERSTAVRAAVRAACADGLRAPVPLRAAAHVGQPRPVRDAGRLAAPVGRARTILETNGRRWHDDATDYEHDNDEWSVPGRHGFRLVLATWNKVTRAPDDLVDELLATMSARVPSSA